MIKVYEPTEKKFQTNGLGSVQPISCIETKKKGLEEWKLEIKADVTYQDLLVKDKIVWRRQRKKVHRLFVCKSLRFRIGG